MAKPEMPKPEGGVHDPLNKWDKLNSIREAATTDVLEGAAEVNRLREALQQPNLTHGARLALAKSLIDSKVNLEKAKRVGQQIVNDLNATRRLDQQINFRLNAIKSYLANNQTMDLEVMKRVRASETALTELLDEAKDLSGSVEGIDGILSRVINIDSTLKDLPKDLRADLKDQATTLKDIEKRQKEAEDFLVAHGKKMDDLKAGIKGWARKKAMGIADRVGIGAFSVGGLIRAGIGAKNVVKKTYNGVNNTRKYLNTLAEAKRMSANPSRVKGATPGSYKGLNDPDNQGNSSGTVRDLIGVVKKLAKHYSVRNVLDKLTGWQNPEDGPPKDDEKNSLIAPKNTTGVKGVSNEKLVQEVHGLRMDLKSTISDSTEQANDQLDVQKSVEGKVTEYLEYAQRYQRRLLDALGSKNKGEGDSIFGTLLKGGVGALIKKLLPGLGGLLAGGLGGGLIRRLSGKVIGLIWGAIRGATGGLSKLLRSGVGLLTRAGSLALASAATFMKKGAVLAIELGKRAGAFAVTAAAALAKFIKDGAKTVAKAALPGAAAASKKVLPRVLGAVKRSAGLGMLLHTDSLNANEDEELAKYRARGATIDGPPAKTNPGTATVAPIAYKTTASPAPAAVAPAVAPAPAPAVAPADAISIPTPTKVSTAETNAITGVATLSSANNSTDRLKDQIASRKESVEKLEALINTQQKDGVAPEGFAQAQKDLIQQNSDLKTLELRLSVAQNSGVNSDGQDQDQDQDAKAVPISNTTSDSSSVSAPAPATTVAPAGGGRGSGGNNNGVPYTAPESPLAKASSASASKPYVGTTGSKVSEAANKLFQIRGGANVDGLNPGLQSNMVGMAKEYHEQTGKTIPINSGFRSFEEQSKLYATKPKGYAARPGRSIHNFGGAFDTDSVIGNDLDRRGLLAKYGMERPLAHEKWHIQPMGLTLSAARAGVFSADEPNNQGGEAKTSQSESPFKFQVQNSNQTKPQTQTAEVQTTGTPKTASSVPTTPANSIQIQTAEASPVAGSYSGGSTYNTATGSRAGARPAAQALSAPEPPAFAQSRKEEPSISTATPPRQTTSMGSNPRYGVRDIPTFDQSDSLFLAMNLGVMG